MLEQELFALLEKLQELFKSSGGGAAGASAPMRWEGG